MGNKVHRVFHLPQPHPLLSSLISEIFTERESLRSIFTDSSFICQWDLLYKEGLHVGRKHGKIEEDEEANEKKDGGG